MRQIEFFSIQNPCIGVCESGPRGYCKGCFRSREERQFWNQLEDDVRRKVVQAAAMRKRRAQQIKPSQDDDSAEPEQGALF